MKFISDELAEWLNALPDQIQCYEGKILEFPNKALVNMRDMMAMYMPKITIETEYGFIADMSVVVIMDMKDCDKELVIEINVPYEYRPTGEIRHYPDGEMEMEHHESLEAMRKAILKFWLKYEAE